MNGLGQNKAVLLSLDEVRIEEFDLCSTGIRQGNVGGELFLVILTLSKFNDYSKISFILQILLTYVIGGPRLDHNTRITLKKNTGAFHYGFKFLCLFNVFNQVKEFCIMLKLDSSTVADKIVAMTGHASRINPETG